MNKIISIINEELDLIKKQLSNKNITDKNQLIQEKKQLEDFMFLINFSQEYDIRKDSTLNIVSLPYEENSGYEEYRILNDYETENREHWTELKINNEPIRLYPSDIIIQKK